MKKLGIVLLTGVMTILFSSCDTTPHTEIVEITHNGDTHEMVLLHGRHNSFSTRGITHWPSCKYCISDCTGDSID